MITISLNIRAISHNSQCTVDPLNPLFKLDFTGVNIILHNFAVKNVSWVLVGTVSLRNIHNI